VASGLAGELDDPGEAASALDNDLQSRSSTMVNRGSRIRFPMTDLLATSDHGGTLGDVDPCRNVQHSMGVTMSFGLSTTVGTWQTGNEVALGLTHVGMVDVLVVI
jgi:hypothetical protein